MQGALITQGQMFLEATECSIVEFISGERTSESKYLYKSSVCERYDKGRDKK